MKHAPPIQTEQQHSKHQQDWQATRITEDRDAKKADRDKARLNNLEGNLERITTAINDILDELKEDIKTDIEKYRK